MFYNYSFFDESYNYHSLKWTGYNDAYFFSEVIKQEGFGVKKENGKTFRFDYGNCEVFEILED